MFAVFKTNPWSDNVELEVFAKTLKAPEEAPWGARLGPLETVTKVPYPLGPAS